MKHTIATIAILLSLTIHATAQMDWVKEHYSKQEVRIRMRDGVRLFTSIYIPKDDVGPRPILLKRTPYSCEPYGADAFPRSLGPNPGLMRSGYIFVTQDVRGRYMSEGGFREMTPYDPLKKDSTVTDESSDTWDTIEWLLANIKPNNGRVGIYGISYPGFYATASLPGAHPAVKAVSPQAPVTDEFIGDDANHNGAFFLLDNFSFMNYFDAHRNGPVQDYGAGMFPYDAKDAYDFFLKLGPLSRSNDVKYFNHAAQIWSEFLAHDTYDEYWKSRNIRTHLHDIRPATLVVGGWFDAEDLFGALNTYATLEQRNAGRQSNRLVMGPWTHGAWARDDWSRFATHVFGTNVNRFYQDSLEMPFFEYHLKDKGAEPTVEAWTFETGSNKWIGHAQWPPAGIQAVPLYFSARSGLTREKPTSPNGALSYISDPANPIPYTGKKMGDRNDEYVTEDQRFLKGRKDLLSFTGEPLKEDLHIAGPVRAHVYLSTTGTDADIIVKLIDVFPDDAPNGQGGMQRLVRGEVFRGKFRRDYTNPSPFVPGQVDSISYSLPDVSHVFAKGHRIMVQVQSSWFPIVDRNPQTFTRIPDAKEDDFKKAEIRIHASAKYPSRIEMPVLDSGF